MSDQTYIQVDAEDALLAAIAVRLLAEFSGKLQLDGNVEVWNGKSNIDKRIPGWNRGAKFGYSRLVLRDLDTLAPPDSMENCPEFESSRLLKGAEQSPNLLLRFAVVEAESWLMADGDALSEFLGVSDGLKISLADAVENPKARLIALARKSRRKSIRNGIPPSRASGRTIGRSYNRVLTEFVQTRWCPYRAARCSKSLRRTLDRLESFARPDASASAAADTMP